MDENQRCKERHESMKSKNHVLEVWMSAGFFFSKDRYVKLEMKINLAYLNLYCNGPGSLFARF